MTTPCPTHGTRSLDDSGRCLPSCGHGWKVEPLSLVRPPDRERCINCEAFVLAMFAKGTGFCGSVCEKINAQYQVDEIERARNETECSP